MNANNLHGLLIQLDHFVQLETLSTHINISVIQVFMTKGLFTGPWEEVKGKGLANVSPTFKVTSSNQGAK